MKNYHIIKVSYLGPTNIKGSRVKMYSDRFQKAKIVPYETNNGFFKNYLEIANHWLLRAGFDIVGQAECKDCYYIITETFKEL